MAITEESRHHLYQRLEEVLGPEEASTLMQHLPPIGWADVATKHDLDQLATVLNLRMDNTDLRTEHRFDSMEQRFDERFAAMDQRFDSMEQRFDHRFVAMEQRFDERFAAMDQRFDSMEQRFDERFVAMDRRFDERLTATDRRSDDRIDAAVARFEDRLASGLAGVELTMITAFGDFRDQLHAEQRTLQRQVILLLLTTLVTISVASIGLR